MNTTGPNHSAVRMLLSAAVLLSALVGRPMGCAAERESAAADEFRQPGSVVSLRDMTAPVAALRPAGTVQVLASLHDLSVPANPGCFSDATSATPRKFSLLRRDARRPSGSGSPSLIALQICLQV